MIYELRQYTLHSGATERMIERFRRVNIPLFTRHGITLENAWIDHHDEPRFFFLASFSDRATREEAWARYHTDPDFIAAQEEQSTIIDGIELTLMESVLPGLEGK